MQTVMRRHTRFFVFLAMLAVFAIIFFGCSHNGPSNGDAGKKIIPLVDQNSKKVGEAVLTPVEKGVRVQITASGLSVGPHAVHFHETGNCQSPTFESAGNHFSPDHHKHGYVSNGPHAGDMDNAVVGVDGKLMLDTVNPHVTLTPGRNSLLKNGGTALIIHSKPDDYRSQPAGNAGDRIVCGVIQASAEGTAGTAHRDANGNAAM